MRNYGKIIREARKKIAKISDEMREAERDLIRSSINGLTYAQAVEVLGRLYEIGIVNSKGMLTDLVDRKIIEKREGRYYAVL
jgi:bifunctional N-acetylglucosamine-1-phosphate-uridyltransferase/glucosamine-1-phosphate-acetyltransferase GlmU-like protein